MAESQEIPQEPARYDFTWGGERIERVLHVQTEHQTGKSELEE